MFLLMAPRGSKPQGPKSVVAAFSTRQIAEEVQGAMPEEKREHCTILEFPVCKSVEDYNKQRRAAAIAAMDPATRELLGV